MEGAAPDPTSVWVPEPLTQERAPDAPPLAESQLGDQTTWGHPGAQDPRPCKKHKNTPQQKEKQRQRQQEFLLRKHGFDAQHGWLCSVFKADGTPLKGKKIADMFIDVSPVDDTPVKPADFLISDAWQRKAGPQWEEVFALRLNAAKFAVDKVASRLLLPRAPRPSPARPPDEGSDKVSDK